jgi:hypothetical protein
MARQVAGQVKAHEPASGRGKTPTSAYFQPPGASCSHQKETKAQLSEMSEILKKTYI